MPEYQDAARAAPMEASASPWGPALALLFTLLRRWKFRIAFCALMFAGLGVAAKLTIPVSYTSVEQLLFDPGGLKIFASDAGNTRLDANAEINFVESQMGVLLSEGVLSRVIARECKLVGLRADSQITDEVAPPASFQRLCQDQQAETTESSARAIDGLRKMVSVKRAERSFLVDVTATSTQPEFAAQLASAVVKAYIAEDASTRASMANRLTSELNARIETIRKSLSETEAKAESYRSDKHLIRVGEKLLIEQKLADASAAMNTAQIQFERASARLKQLETTPAGATGLGALGDEEETRPLALMLDRRAAALADLAPLQARLGARNPLLLEARSRVDQAERGIEREIKSIRAAAREQASRARHELDNLSRSVADLSKELSKARESQIALKALEQSSDANRKLLESLENRSRELSEMGKIDVANLRIASKARPPEFRPLSFAMGLWGVAGLVLGLLLSVCFTAFVALWRAEVAASRAPVSAPVPEPAPVPLASAPEEMEIAQAYPDDLSGELASKLAHISRRMRREPAPRGRALG